MLGEQRAALVRTCGRSDRPTSDVGGRPMIRWRRKALWTGPVDAWYLEEGAALVDGSTVLAVHRNALARTVRLVSTRGSLPEVPADHPVTVVLR